MGVGQAIFAGSVVIVGTLLLVLYGALKISGRQDMARVVDEQIAAAEQTYRTELRAAPVVGVPYVAITDDGSHDLYPHMSEHAREVCIGYLETLFAVPARERAS